MAKAQPPNTPAYARTASDLGFHVSAHTEGNSTIFHIAPGEGWPVWLVAQAANEPPFASSLWINIRTTSWDYAGNRSDLHELLSSIVAIWLRMRCHLSAPLLRRSHPAMKGPTEYHSRFLTFERHGLIELHPGDPREKAVDTLLKGLLQSCLILHDQFHFCPDFEHAVAYDREDAWAKQILRCLHERKSQLNGWHARSHPDWRWFLSLRSGVSLFHLEEGALAFLRGVLPVLPTVEGISHRVYGSRTTPLNAISLQRLRIGSELLQSLEGAQAAKDALVVPVEDRFYMLGSNHLIEVEDDCSARSVAQERKQIEERQQREREMLFPPSVYEWATAIDGDRFELLVWELLAHESGVIRVWKVSTTTEADRGRDLQAEWFLPDNPRGAPGASEMPYHKRRVLVQCKGHRKSVGKSEVPDIVDTLVQHDATGYLLVVSSAITTPLFDFLQTLRRRGDLWVDWWTRGDIEERLRLHPQIAKRYADVVRER